MPVKQMSCKYCYESGKTEETGEPWCFSLGKKNHKELECEGKFFKPSSKSNFCEYKFIKPNKGLDKFF